MSESLTGETVATPASNEPTGQEQQQPTAESTNQETIPNEQSQGAVSDDTANQNQNQQTGEGEEKQTQQTSGENKTDDGLAKFAKSQGFNLDDSSDEVKRALKIAHDNQKAFRSQSTKGAKVSDAVEEMSDGSLRAELEQLKFEKQEEKFFEDNRDKTLQPVMVEILNEKAAQYGNEYAYALSRDLDALYAQAQVRNGSFNAQIDPEQIRREERESINRQMSANAPQAHATQGGQEKKPQLTPEWFTNVYDSRNPEHIELLKEAGLR